MIFKTFMVLVLFATCCTAASINTEHFREFLAVPFVDQRDLKPESLQTKEEIPVYTIVLVNENSENAAPVTTNELADNQLNFKVEKRSIDERNDDDLQTAAGSNILRPLFVYRQQVAYRQRIKNRRRRF